MRVLVYLTLAISFSACQRTKTTSQTQSTADTLASVDVQLQSSRSENNFQTENTSEIKIHRSEVQRREIAKELRPKVKIQNEFSNEIDSAEQRLATLKSKRPSTPQEATALNVAITVIQDNINNLILKKTILKKQNKTLSSELEKAQQGAAANP